MTSAAFCYSDNDADEAELDEKVPALDKDDALKDERVRAGCSLCNWHQILLLLLSCQFNCRIPTLRF